VLINRFFPEYMPEPTTERRVPRLRDMSIKALKKVFRGKYV